MIVRLLTRLLGLDGIEREIGRTERAAPVRGGGPLLDRMRP